MTRGGMLMRNFNGIMGKGSQGSLIERQDQLTQVYNKSTAEELIRKVLMNGGAPDAQGRHKPVPVVFILIMFNARYWRHCYVHMWCCWYEPD